MEFLTVEFQGNLVWQWLVAVGILLFVGFFFQILLRFAVRRLRAVVIKTPGRFDDLVVDLLEKTRFLFIFVVSLYAGSLILVLPDFAEEALPVVFVLTLLLQAGYWGNAFVAFWIRRGIRRKLDEDAATATSLAALGFVAKVVLWTVVILLMLDNLGVNVTTLIATLGVGGIAIALAVQNILSDLFASLSIILDKPFVIGDFIIVGELMGTVERIGLKTTRVRSLTGELIIFSNSDLLSSRVRNYKRMYERRIAFSIGVTYQTSPEMVEEIPAVIEEIVSGQLDVRFDRCHFKTFGDFAIIFETVYYVLVPDYGAYMNVQQAINLAIMWAFAERHIEFAYPTQTLFVQRDSSEGE
ncbi:mechanosensitive ion channel family protein [Candidatus Bipolaricaulota bacterium]|nr:mechanosensitive ion channel family protein [Candidatus Bipolaricaulota bacterium]